MTIADINNQGVGELLNNINFSCINTAQNDHDFMFNSLVPFMESLLNEISSILIAPENSDPDINYYLQNGDIHIFNWNSAFHYMSLVGLGEAEAFGTTIINDEYFLFQQYNTDINNAQLFNHNIYN